MSVSPRLPGDPLRIVIAVVVLVLSLPWFAATLGIYFPQGVFLTTRIVTEGQETLPAVHRGEHHGLDCALLLLAAVLLSRARPLGHGVDRGLTAALSLAAAYGLVNASEDFWHEQVVKRGWSSLRIPGAQVPTVSWVWLVILLLTAVAYGIFRLERRAESHRVVVDATASPIL